MEVGLPIFLSFTGTQYEGILVNIKNNEKEHGNG